MIGITEYSMSNECLYHSIQSLTSPPLALCNSYVIWAPSVRNMHSCVAITLSWFQISAHKEGWGLIYLKPSSAAGDTRYLVNNQLRNHTTSQSAVNISKVFQLFCIQLCFYSSSSGCLTAVSLFFMCSSLHCFSDQSIPNIFLL